MNNKQQTAVDWLYEQIDNRDMGEVPLWVYDFIEQAKEMEKEQIIDAHFQGYDSGLCGGQNGDEYYKETYK